MRAHEVHVVLEGHRNARHGAQRLAGGAGGVRGARSLERELGGDLEEGLDLGLASLDGGKRGLSDLDSRELAGGDAGSNLAGGERVDVCH